ncbi:MAG: hypothetical protein ABIO45_14510 [Burkholderiaceae bacterium]
MRAAPALQLSLTRFRTWHAALLLLVVADLACLAAWSRWRPDPLPAGADLALSMVAFTCLAIAWSARARPATLAWDGQAWHIGAPGAAPDQLTPGRLRLRIDLGHWMLLQFVPDHDPFAAGAWLPVQRADLASHWHALRCAASAPAARAAPMAFDPRSGD